MPRVSAHACKALVLSLLLPVFFMMAGWAQTQQAASPETVPSTPLLAPAQNAMGSNESTLPVNKVPPTPQGLNIYVNDYAQLLTAEDQATLKSQLQALDQAGIAQVSVLILPNTDQDLGQFAFEIMNTWGIQHKNKKDGLLVLVNAHRLRQNLSGNRIFVATGLALEEKLPDALVGRILDQEALPAFDNGEFSGGITRATLSIAHILAGDKNLRQQYSQPDDEDSSWVAILVILFLLLLFFNRRGGGRRGGGGFYGGGYYGGLGGGFGGGFGGGGGGFGGGFGGGGDSSGGGGAGR